MADVHPMARQLAQLLTGSDLDELKEVVRRWVDTAVSERQRQQFMEMGTRILELKAALTESGATPSREELELALSTMLALAKDADAETIQRRAPKEK
jgi:urease accessory protein UreF